MKFKPHYNLTQIWGCVGHPSVAQVTQMTLYVGIDLFRVGSEPSKMHLTEKTDRELAELCSIDFKWTVRYQQCH